MYRKRFPAGPRRIQLFVGHVAAGEAARSYPEEQIFLWNEEPQIWHRFHLAWSGLHGLVACVQLIWRRHLNREALDEGIWEKKGPNCTTIYALAYLYYILNYISSFCTIIDDTHELIGRCGARGLHQVQTVLFCVHVYLINN